jgi:bifunctional enzyme CysN/CysC
MAGHLRITTAGSVDDGKSTLIGRLLHDSKSVFEDQAAQVAKASQRRHGASGGVDLSLLTDGLRAEREQGITIDVAYRYFATPKRSFIVADTPGHVTHTRNMFTGASTADLAIVLVDARNGVVEQSRRHACIAGMLGIKHVVLAVNKMDLVDWSRAAFEQVVRDFDVLARTLGITNVQAIPLNARDGDFVVEPGEQAPWYEGPTLLDFLETVDVEGTSETPDAAPLRFPVQWVVRPGGDEHHDYRGYAGQVERGCVRVGDAVTVLPSGATSTISAIDTYDGQLQSADAGHPVTLLLADELDIVRGDVLTASEDVPPLSYDADIELCWMHETPLIRGRAYLLKHASRTVRASVVEVINRRDMTTLDVVDDANGLELNDIGLVHIRTSDPLAWEPYDESKAMGSIILIDEHSCITVAAGMVRRSIPRDVPRTSTNVVRQPAAHSPEERHRLLGLRGATLWLTGLPASGKSTIATEVVRQLVDRGIPAFALDGDNLRHGITGDLGFEPSDRAESARRTAHMAAAMAEAGIVTVVALLSPYHVDRSVARSVHERAGVPFFEAFVDTPIEVCEQRDPKRLYARAHAGELRNVTGVDAPYEAPLRPELRLADVGLDARVELVLALLGDANLLER